MYTDPQKREAFRERLHHLLHEGRGKSGHAFSFALISLIILSIAILPLEFSSVSRGYSNFFVILEAIITGIFTVEYMLRVYAAPKRLRYVFSFYGLVDLFAILPFYLGLIGSQFLRILRVIRMIRIGHIQAAATSDSDVETEKSIGIVHGVEGVEHIVSHHAMYLLIGCIPPIVAVSISLAILLIFPVNAITVAVVTLFLIFALLFLWKAWLDYSYDVIYITTQRLLFQNQHILGRSVNQVNYHAITNVKPSYTGIFSYLFGYGSIMIETAADQLGHFGLDMVREHEKAAHLIMQKCFAARSPAAEQDPSTSSG